MSEPKFDNASLAKQLKKLSVRKEQLVTVGVVAENGDAGVEASLSKDIGRHDMFVQAEASWFRHQGYRAAAFFGWKPKS